MEKHDFQNWLREATDEDLMWAFCQVNREMDRRLGNDEITFTEILGGEFE